MVTDVSMLYRVAAEFPSKYRSGARASMAAFFIPMAWTTPSHIYEVTPTVAFGFGKKKGLSATPWLLAEWAGESGLLPGDRSTNQFPVVVVRVVFS